MTEALGFGSTSDAIDRVEAALIAAGVTTPFGFGKYLLSQRQNPLIGSIVIIPKDGPITPPRFNGDNPRNIFTVDQGLEIHCWRAAAKQSDPAKQYRADLKAAELLTGAVLRAFERLAGAKRGGRRTVTEAGENVTGAEVVTTISIFVETFDVAYTLAPLDTVFVPDVEMEFTHGSTDPNDWTLDSGSDS